MTTKVYSEKYLRGAATGGDDGKLGRVVQYVARTRLGLGKE